MILGILSDTHGRSHTTRAAIDRLSAAGASHFVHCGDVADFGSDALAVLSQLPSGKTTFVFGNNDDPPELARLAKDLDLHYLGQAGELTLAGKVIAVTHGDRPRLVDEVIARAASVDYLLTGHTHTKHDLRVGRLRRINPGALHRAARKTVATLDLATDTLSFHDVT